MLPAKIDQACRVRSDAIDLLDRAGADIADEQVACHPVDAHAEGVAHTA